MNRCFRFEFSLAEKGYQSSPLNFPSFAWEKKNISKFLFVLLTGFFFTVKPKCRLSWKGESHFYPTQCLKLFTCLLSCLVFVSIFMCGAAIISEKHHKELNTPKPPFRRHGLLSTFWCITQPGSPLCSGLCAAARGM